MWRPPCRGQVSGCTSTTLSGDGSGRETLAGSPHQGRTCSTGWCQGPRGGHCSGCPLHPHPGCHCATWAAPVPGMCVGAPGAGGGVVRGARGRPLSTEGALSLRLFGEWGSVLTKSRLCAGDVPSAAATVASREAQAASALSPLQAPLFPGQLNPKSQLPLGWRRGRWEGCLSPVAATGQLGPAATPTPWASCPPSSCWNGLSSASPAYP